MRKSLFYGAALAVALATLPVPAFAEGSGFLSAVGPIFKFLANFWTALTFIVPAVFLVMGAGIGFGFIKERGSFAAAAIAFVFGLSAAGVTYFAMDKARPIVVKFAENAGTLSDQVISPDGE